MAHARQFELLELDRVISTPLLDSEFLIESDTTDPYSARVGLVAMRGAFTIASSNRLVNTISEDIRDHEIVILDFSETAYMDQSAALVVSHLTESAIEEKTQCIVIGLTPELAANLNSLNALNSVPPTHILPRLEDARILAQRLLPA